MRARGVRVLLVEDNEDIRYLLHVLAGLAARPIEIVDAESGEEGVARWREARPDVIVLDHRLPGISGLEVATTVLAEDPTMPVILFTAVPSDDLVIEAHRIGVRACLSKDEVSRVPQLVLELADE